MKDKILIIDGNSLLYRAFYALPPLLNSKGVNTGAVYGFTNMIIKLLTELSPKFIVVAFDKSRITFRNKIYTEYKAHRKPTPPELREQFPLVKEMLSAFGIVTLELDDFEADDIIGTLTVQAKEQKLESIVVTGDRDALQLINDTTTVLITKKGISEMKEFTTEVLFEEYELSPDQIIDLKGLMGDASDNIPGVPGVGEKTALKLLKEYSTVEVLLENLDKIKGKLGEKLVANKQQAILSKELATIAKNAPIEKEELCNFTIKPDRQKLNDFLAQLEFRNMNSKLDKVLSVTSFSLQPIKEEIPVEIKEITSVDEASKMLLKDKTVFYFKHNITGKFPRIELESIEIFNGDSAGLFKNSDESWQVVKKWLAKGEYTKIGCDVKTLYQTCQNEQIDLAGLQDDCAVMVYLVDQTITKYDIKPIAERFGIDTAGIADTIVLKKFFDLMQEKMQQMKFEKLYKEIEFPLVKVLAQMELNGIAVDKQPLEEMSAEIGKKLEELTKKITDLAGEEFNINSPKQLGVILFERLALPVMKKTKTGYSTDAEVLENLSGMHPVVDAILEYRLLSKLQSTYLEGMKPLIDVKTGRIYSHFQQLVTTTGRLSSTEPNLQNIPVRTELGKKIREFFVPGEGYDYLMALDYSQVELRILAHISGDELFTEAFKKEQDIHSRTASEVFDVPLEKITSELRTKAKAVNFGIVYGISDYGLARDLGISRTESATYIKNYFARYTGIKNYMEKTVEEARENGYVTTLFDRRRYLPEINSSNFNRRSFAERTAINTPIQGTAADIIKYSMVEVAKLLENKKMKSRLLLQVHDELVFEAVEEEVEILKKLVKDKMQQAAKLDVPLVVDVTIGKNWAQTKG